MTCDMCPADLTSPQSVLIGRCHGCRSPRPEMIVGPPADRVALQVGLCTGGTLDVYESGRLDVSRVTAETLARGLSYVTRFGGQAGQFSVAEHSVNMVRLLRTQRRCHPSHAEVRACLLHDAAECLGVGDTQRFVKHKFQSPALTEFDRALTEALWVHLCGLHYGPWKWVAAGVKNLDRTIGAIEARVLGFPYDEKELPQFDREPHVARPRKLGPADAAKEWMELWDAAGGFTA